MRLRGPLEALVMDGLPSPSFWRGQRVFLTGHTGFKGGWAALWLARLGAQVCGYSLAPSTSPALFTAIGVSDWAHSNIGDIGDLGRMRSAFEAFDPTVVIHMAAQALVRQSYLDPLRTYSTNVLGTVNVLELARASPRVRATVIVTSDKCYENSEQIWAYRETDRLGGHDPYSSSKACAELVVSAYWSSYFQMLPSQGLATVRAGNVIGGGDWSNDRLVPDLVSAFAQSQTAILRRPESVRPWQHVLDPICGYLLAAEEIAAGRSSREFGTWNFGPDPTDNAPVVAVAEMIASAWGAGAHVQCRPEPNAPHEANLLMLDATKARLELGWRPRWSLHAAVERTAQWYRAFGADEDMRALSESQIEDYVAATRKPTTAPAPSNNTIEWT